MTCDCTPSVTSSELRGVHLSSWEIQTAPLFTLPGSLFG